MRTESVRKQIHWQARLSSNAEFNTYECSASGTLLQPLTMRISFDEKAHRVPVCLFITMLPYVFPGELRAPEGYRWAEVEGLEYVNQINYVFRA